MNPREFFNPALAAALLLSLAACGGPSQEAAPNPPPSQPQEQVGSDDDALRAPSRPEAGVRQPRGVESDPAAAASQPGGAGFAEGHPLPDEARPLLGEWIVAGHRFGAVAAMDDAAAMRLHGREVSYGDAHANSGADSCGDPLYRVEQRNVVETLLVEFRTSPAALGLDQATDAQVLVIDVECSQPWVTLGSRVLVLPDGLVLAPWDGVFFELQPR